MAIAWLDRIRRWFHSEPPSSVSFDPLYFERLCLENPQRALVAFQQGHRDLADEFERVYQDYERTLENTAIRLKTMDSKDLHREIRTLRDVHDALRRTLRRLDASMLSASEIERELGEWRMREKEGGPWHADHPKVRAEILRSELTVREERPLTVIPLESSPFAETSEQGRYEIVSDESRFSDSRETKLPEVSVEQLIHAIRHANREVERWHESPEIGRDAVDEIKELRRLHAILKQRDRENGTMRDRIELAVKTRDSY
jgi:hypothetical protein